MSKVTDEPTGRKAPEPKAAQVHEWWHALDLLAGIGATPTQHLLLVRIYRHIHKKKGYAWASQETLAREMNVDLSTVERGFRWAKRLGLVQVRRVITGKRPSDRHNEYWIDFRVVDMRKQLRESLEQPVPMPDDDDEQGAPMPLTNPAPMTGKTEPINPSSSTPLTRQMDVFNPAKKASKPGTHAGGGLDLGFEVKQRERKAAAAALHTLPSSCGFR